LLFVILDTVMFDLLFISTFIQSLFSFCLLISLLFHSFSYVRLLLCVCLSIFL
jgi:hypothetical protein